MDSSAMLLRFWRTVLHRSAYINYSLILYPAHSLQMKFCIGEQYLPHVVPLVFSSCNLDDGSAVDIDECDDEVANGFGGVSSDDEAHDEPRVRNISIRTGVLDEKAAATQALGLFALHTKTSFAPYPLTDFFNSLVPVILLSQPQNNHNCYV